MSTPEKFRFEPLSRALLLLKHEKKTVEDMEALIDSHVYRAYKRGRADAAVTLAHAQGDPA